MNAETLKELPRIMYVCEVCAEGCPEACGYYDADEIRKTPGGEWLCIYCYDEYEHEDCETAPLFSDLPSAPQLAADNIALQAEVDAYKDKWTAQKIIYEDAEKHVTELEAENAKLRKAIEWLKIRNSHNLYEHNS